MICHSVFTWIIAYQANDIGYFVQVGILKKDVLSDYFLKKDALSQVLIERISRLADWY